MYKIRNRILDVLYPRGITCDICGKELTDGDDRFLSLCPYCYGRMEVGRSGPSSVSKCDVYSLFKYESVRDIILRCKDGGRPYLATTIGRLMYRFYVEKGIIADAVCYIPCGKKSFSRRGYDHMKLIAKEFSDCVVYIGDGKITVAVPAPEEGLSEDAVARITEIICSETEYEASQLSIIQVKA